MTTMPTTNARADERVRAPLYLLLSRALHVPDRDAYIIADMSIDVDDADTIERLAHLDVPLHHIDALYAYARSFYSSDDDYDDFRRELTYLYSPHDAYTTVYVLDDPDDIPPTPEFDPDLIELLRTV